MRRNEEEGGCAHDRGISRASSPPPGEMALGTVEEIQIPRALSSLPGGVALGIQNYLLGKAAGAAARIAA